MQTFSVKTLRVSELATLLDQIATKDLGAMKDIRLTHSVIKDLMEYAKPLNDASSELRAKQQELLKSEGYRERFIEESKEMNDDEKEELGKQLDREFQVKSAETFKGEIEQIALLGQTLVEVKIGNEEFEKLRELFEKHCISKYTQKEALLEVGDALGL